MQKPKPKNPKRGNFLVDRTFRVPVSEINRNFSAPLDSINKINAERDYMNNLEKNKELIKKEYQIRNSSIPLAPTQFND